MLSVWRHSVIVVALIFLCASGLSAAPNPPTPQEIERWVEQLGDKDFDKRQEASKRLWEAGEPAEKALEAAAKSDDAEVRRRSGEILEKFKWGVYPDTPKKVVDLIQRYRAAENPAKLELIRDLFDEGIAGCRALVKIAAVEEDPPTRAKVFRLIGGNVTRFMPVALADNKFDLVENLLDLGVQNEDVGKANLSHYCAYCLLRGKLDDRIAGLRAKADRTKQQTELLAYLYRAKGDLRAALAVSQQAQDGPLTEGLLYELGDWKELAKRDLTDPQMGGAEKMSFRAAYRRLAGDTKGFEDTLAEFRKAADAAPPAERPIQSYYLAKLQFLNDRPGEALEVLERSGQYAMLFEILCVQFEYGEAFALVDKARKDGHKELPLLEILQARTLCNLGEKDKALPLFARRAAEIKPGNDFSWFEDLIGAEYQAGLKDEAFAHAAKLLEVSQDAGWPRRLFGKLFPDRAEAAEIWWKYFRQDMPNVPKAATPLPPIAETMKQLREQFEGKVAARDVEERIEKARPALKNVRPEEADQWWLGLADAARAAKLDDLERSCLENGASVATLQRLGDLRTEKKDWAAAAKAYREAWDKGPTQPMPLLLAGKALAQAGDEKEGKKLVEQAHWLPLGDQRARNDFAVGLARRGYRDDARRENELMRRVGEAGSYYGGDAERRLSLEALLKKDYLRAAASQEHTLLRCLHTYVRFLQNPAYLGVPTLAHRFRARGLLDAGKFDEAMKEVAYCRAALPGDVDLAILLVPEMERLGHKKEADDLFAQTTAVYDKLLADYPNCPWAHNSLAWLSVCCRRDLDKALAHAQKAVELSPTTAGHHDTLAEIYFQQGDKERALGAEKKAIELEPQRSFFRKQLRRMEVGDPKAERPSELDDDD